MCLLPLASQEAQNLAMEGERKFRVVSPSTCSQRTPSIVQDSDLDDSSRRGEAVDRRHVN
eukprot:m.440654 g.440654  ORF g.440654 m.440654 type:complete len:60 (+) comp18545_c0_seq1:17-196(+)